MIKVRAPNPSIPSGRKTSCAGGEVNMDISFKVSAECMYGKKDAGKKPFLVCPIFNDVCGNKRDTVHKVSIQPEEGPEVFWHSKGNMLPGSFGKGVKTVFDPYVSGLFATGRTESGFAAMRDFDAFGACRANKMMVS